MVLPNDLCDDLQDRPTYPSITRHHIRHHFSHLTNRKGKETKRKQGIKRKWKRKRKIKIKRERRKKTFLNPFYVCCDPKRIALLSIHLWVILQFHILHLLWIFSFIRHMCVFVSMCACICVKLKERKIERERERKRESQSKGVESERMKKREREEELNIPRRVNWGVIFQINQIVNIHHLSFFLSSLLSTSHCFFHTNKERRETKRKREREKERNLPERQREKEINLGEREREMNKEREIYRGLNRVEVLASLFIGAASFFHFFSKIHILLCSMLFPLEFIHMMTCDVMTCDVMTCDAGVNVNVNVNVNVMKREKKERKERTWTRATRW